MTWSEVRMEKIFLFLLLLLICAVPLYLLLIRGRTNAPGAEKLYGWAYAHRGLHNKPAVPENSLAAFRLAAEQGYGAELDVHLLADGGLAVIHDYSLERTVGISGKVEDLTTTQLKNCHLEGSQEVVPTLQEVLKLVAGRVPLIIELKSIKNNAFQLTEAVSQVLKSYEGVYALGSVDPRCLFWLKRRHPEIIRGQLSEDFLKNTAHLGKFVDFVQTYLFLNWLVKPDFIAYRFAERHNPSNQLCLRFWGMQGAAWTITAQEDLELCLTEGLLPIFEGFEAKLPVKQKS